MKFTGKQTELQEGSLREEEGARQQEMTSCSPWPARDEHVARLPPGGPQSLICRDVSACTWGLQATYHQVLDKLELLVPEKSRLMCNSRRSWKLYFSGLPLVR